MDINLDVLSMFSSTGEQQSRAKFSADRGQTSCSRHSSSHLAKECSSSRCMIICMSWTSVLMINGVSLVNQSVARGPVASHNPTCLRFADRLETSSSRYPNFIMKSSRYNAFKVSIKVLTTGQTRVIETIGKSTTPDIYHSIEPYSFTMRFTSLIVFVTAASALSTQVSYHSRDGQSTENADIYNWIKRGDQSADDADIYNWIKRDGESADKRSGTYGEHIGEVPTLANISPWSSTY